MRRESELQRVLCGADGDAAQAAGAFDGADLEELGYGEVRGAGFVALVAVDAGVGVAADFYRAHSGDDAHECAVGAEEAAPDVLDHQREERESGDDRDADEAHVAEEVEHLDVGDDAEGCEQELLEAFGGHGDDDVEEEGEKKILQAAQGDVQPAGEGEVAAEEFVAELPEVFGYGADRAEPGAEGFFEQQAGEQKDDEEKHRRRVDGGDVMGDEEVLEVHEAGDGKPALDAGGTAEVARLAVGFEVADPEVELEAEPGVECEEGDLDGVADALGVVLREVAEEGLLRLGG